ncbi:nitrate ABC transporter ATP-binding protein [Spirochaetia bacterium]|nr:nitrate ABC transporter ATP-binding protein [Spirochaetia bacterium]
MNQRPPETVFYCRDILKSYEGKPVVADINLDLAAGGLISLVGPSGIGKTTLFNVLSGVDKPDKGRIFLDGEEITGISGRVSYMMQKDLLLEYRTVLDNVILPLIIRGTPKKEARHFAASFFTTFGLAGYEKKYPRQLSGGMRQRAALLRTCLNGTSGYRVKSNRTEQTSYAPRRSPVILLDEPFSALDSLTRRTMQDWFQNIMDRPLLGTEKISALFITHDVEEAVFLSDRVYLLSAPNRSGGENRGGEKNPGRISAFFDINTPRPRNRDFSLTPEFAAQKRAILDAIDGSV